MARRRINTRFLAIVLIVLVVLAGGGVAAFKFMRRGDPTKYIAAAHQYEIHQQWEQALEPLGRAVALMPKDASLRVEYGQDLHFLAQQNQDPNKESQARDMWRQAIEVDPSNIKARQSLLDVYEARLEYLQEIPKNDKVRDELNQLFQSVSEMATQLVNLDPKNTPARTAIPALNIRLWLMNIPIPNTPAEAALPFEKRPTDDQKVNAAIADLSAQLRDDPTDTDAGTWSARAHLRQAQLALQAQLGQQALTGSSASGDNAAKLLNQATTTFDQAIAKRPDFAPLYTAKANILDIALRLESHPDQRKADLAQMRDSLDHAQSLVDFKNPSQWLLVKTQWARFLARTDPDAAEKAYREIIAKMPDDVMSKVALADLLSMQPARRNDALALLQQLPDQPPADVSPALHATMVNQLIEAKRERTQILVQELAQATDPAQRQAITAQAQSLIDQLAAVVGDNWKFLKLKGWFQLVQGPQSAREAAQTLDSAVQKMRSQTTSVDPSLLLLQAQAYEAAQQDGDAVTVLEQALSYPAINDMPNPHMELANLYFKRHNDDHLHQQLDWLTQHLPDNPAVIKLQLRVLDPANNPTHKDAAAALYARLPEVNPAEKMAKAIIASQLMADIPEAERLYGAILDKDPGNPAASYNLAAMYAAAGNNDKALSILAAATKLHPNDPNLTILSDKLQGATPQALAAAKAKLIQQDIADPFTREMSLADLCADQNDSDSELLHLKNAQSYQPANPRMLTKLFALEVALHQLGDAKALLPALTKADADNAHGELLLFEFERASGDKAAALDQARKLVKDFPQFSNAWLALGDALAQDGRFDEAATNYQQALDKQGTNRAAYSGLIQCSYATNRTDDAKRYIDAALRQFPSDPDFRFAQVQHELRFGDPDTVVPTLTDALKEHPDQPQNYRLLAQALSQAAAYRAEHADPDGSKQRLAQAHDVLAQAAARWPDDLRFANDLASNSLQQHDIAGADAALKTLAARPAWQGRPEPLESLGDLYTVAAQPASAEPYYRSALAKSSNPVELELKLAESLKAQRKYDDALTILDHDRAVPAVVQERAALLLATNRGPQAEAEIRLAMGNNAAATQPAGANQVLQDILATVYYDEQKLSESESLSNKLLAANPNDITAHLYRALSNLHGHKPDPDAAIPDLTFVRDHQPTLIQARLALAEAYNDKDDSDSAIHELEAAEHVAPADKSVRLQLAELYSNATPPRLIEAQQVLSEALALPQYKNDIDLMRSQAVVQAKSGQGDAAVATIRQAMSLSGNQDAMGRDYLHILLLNKNYPLLISEADTLTSGAAGGPWWAYDYRGQAKAAQAKAEGGDMSGAAKDFDLAMRQAVPQGGRTLAAGVANDAANAIGLDATLALVNQRANDTMWKLVALVLYDRKGDNADALKIAESAMQKMNDLTPAEQDHLLDLAGSLYLSTNPPMGEKAADVYKQVLDRHPDEIWALNNMACVLVDDLNPPQPQKALPYSTRAYDEVQRSGRVQPLIYDTQGWVLIQAGKVNEGIDILQKIGDSADFPDLHYHLGQAYLRKQLPQSAEHELQTASDMLDQASATGKAGTGDAILRQKVDLAMKQAQKLSQNKTQAQATP